MEKITRANLLSNLDALVAEEKKLESKKYEYKTNRAWPGLLKISDINDVDHLIRAYDAIDRDTNRYENTIKMLNLEELGLVSDSDEPITFYGYTRDEWLSDLKLCAIELSDVNKLDKIKNAIKLLKKNMSEDDKFAADMNAVAKLIG